MFTTGSVLQSVNIYIVENLAHSLVALGAVWLVLTLFKIREPGLRIRLLLLPLLLPLFTSPLFYLLFPERYEMPVLPLDRVFSLKAAFDDPELWMPVSSFLTFVIMAVAAFLLLKGALSIIALVYLPRRFHQMGKWENGRLEAILVKARAKAGVARSRILVTPSQELICCSFGLMKPCLLISRGLLQRLDDGDLEAMITHELAHIQRGDGRMSFLLVTLRHILFFNPVVHLVTRRLHLESEMATDDLALSYGLERLNYAQALVTAGGLSSQAVAPQAGYSHFSAGASALRKRVEHILEPGPITMPGYQRWLPAAMAAWIVAVSFFLC